MRIFELLVVQTVSARVLAASGEPQAVTTESSGEKPQAAASTKKSDAIGQIFDDAHTVHLAASARAEAAKKKQTPSYAENPMVQKVVEYLQKISSDASAELSRRQKVFDEGQTGFSDNMATQEMIITDQQAVATQAASDLANAQSALKALTEEDLTKGATVSENKQTLVKLEGTRREEKAAFDEAVKENELFQSALQAAIENFDALAASLDAASLIQVLKKQLKKEVPDATYKGRTDVGSIKVMLTDLQSDVSEHFTTITTEESTRVSSYDEQKSTLERSIETDEARLEEIAGELKTKAAEIEAHTASAAAAKKSEADAAALLKELGEQKDAAILEHDKVTEDINGEISAVGAALSVLQGQPISFLEVNHESTLRKFQDVKSRVIEMLSKAEAQASGLKSSAVHNLGARITAQIENVKQRLSKSEFLATKQEPTYLKKAMDNVIQMINDLIVDLKKANAEDRSMQARCDTDLPRFEQEVQSSIEMLDHVTLAGKTSVAKVGQLTDEAADLQEQATSLQAAMDSRKAQYEAEKSENEKTLSNTREAVGAVDNAMLQLNTAEFANNDKIQNALQMLQMIVIEMSNTIAETQIALDKAEEAYVKYEQDALVSLTGIQGDIVYKTESANAEKATWPNGAKKWGLTDQKLTIAKETLANTQDLCNIAESYEERKAKRDELLATLRDSLGKMNGASLVSVKRTLSKKKDTPKKIVAKKTLAAVQSGSTVEKGFHGKVSWHDLESTESLANGEMRMADDYESRKKSIMAGLRKRQSGADKVRAKEASLEQFVHSEDDIDSQMQQMLEGAGNVVEASDKTAKILKSKSLLQANSTEIVKKTPKKHQTSAEIYQEAAQFLKQVNKQKKPKNPYTNAQTLEIPPKGEVTPVKKTGSKEVPKTKKAGLMLVAKSHTMSLTSLVASEELSAMEKVVALLQKLLEEVNVDQDSDREFYDNMVAYCTSAKQQAEWDVENSDREVLMSTSVSLSAVIDSLNVEIKDLGKQVADGMQGLQTMIKVYEEQIEAANAEEIELTNAVAGVKSAVSILSKRTSNAAGFLEILKHAKTQIEPSVFENQNIRNLLGQKLVFSKNLSLLEVSEKMFQVPAPPSSLTKYSDPGTDQVVGILSSMQESFEEKLQKVIADRSAAKGDYSKLKGTKTDEIAALQTSMESKEVRLAEAGVEKVNTDRQLKKSDGVLKSAKQLLLELKNSCSSQEKDYQDRVATRDEEIGALSTAIEKMQTASDQANANAGAPAVGFSLQSHRLLNDAESSGLTKKLQEEVTKFHMSAQEKASMPTVVRRDAMLKTSSDMLEKEFNQQREMDRVKSEIESMKKTAKKEAQAEKAAQASQNVKSKKQSKFLSAPVKQDIQDESIHALEQAEEKKHQGVLPTTSKSSTYKKAKSQHVTMPKSMTKLALLASQLTAASKAPSPAEMKNAASLIMDKIDGMISEMKKAKSAEIKEKDSCLEEVQAASLKTKNAKHELSKSETKSDVLSAQLSAYPGKLSAVENEIAEAEANLKEIEDAKTKEITVIQTKISGDQESITLLESAIDILQSFYGYSLSQIKQEPRPESDGPSEMPKAAEYAKKGGGGAIVELLQTMVMETKAKIADDVERLEQLKGDFQAKKAEIDNMTLELTRDKAVLEGEEVSTQQDVNEAEALKKDNTQAVMDATDFEQAVGGKCTPLINSFERNQETRQNEIDFIIQVKMALARM